MNAVIGCPYCRANGEADMPPDEEVPDGVIVKIEHTCPGEWSIEVTAK